MSAITSPASRATIQAAVTSSAILSLRMVHYLAELYLGPQRDHAAVSNFLCELERYTAEVHAHGPNAAAETFTPLKGNTP